MKFSVPYDMDKQCIKLCTKLNELGDIQTTESCCGHLVNQYDDFLGVPRDYGSYRRYTDCKKRGKFSWKSPFKFHR